MTKTGIIGGSGLENPDIINSPELINIDTPYGATSSPLLCGRVNGGEVVLLSRHGKDHTISPTAVNNRANIYALKEAGCTRILATTACGSLREEIGRGDIVIPDQLIDFTRHRIITFHHTFEPGNLKHQQMAEPFDSSLRELIISTAGRKGYKIHDGGTLITIEGPRFSTKAESRMFRMWGADIINMSVALRQFLPTRWAYHVIAMCTDYDCWKEDEDPVSWEEVLAVSHANATVIRL